MNIVKIIEETIRNFPVVTNDKLSANLLTNEILNVLEKNNLEIVLTEKEA